MIHMHTMISCAQVKIVPVSKISLLSSSIPYITNVPPTRHRSYPGGITVVMENEQFGLETQLLGMLNID